jgi:hypothetical protein
MVWESNPPDGLSQRHTGEPASPTCAPPVPPAPTALDAATAQDRSTRSSGARCAFLSRARSPAPGPTTERRNRGRHRERSRKVTASRSLLRSRGFKFRPPRAGQRVPARNTALIVKRRYYHARVRDRRGHFISPQADTGVRILMRGGPWVLERHLTTRKNGTTWPFDEFADL